DEQNSTRGASENVSQRIECHIRACCRVQDRTHPQPDWENTDFFVSVEPVGVGRRRSGKTLTALVGRLAASRLARPDASAFQVIAQGARRGTESEDLIADSGESAPDPTMQKGMAPMALEHVRPCCLPLPGMASPEDLLARGTCGEKNVNGCARRVRCNR